MDNNKESEINNKENRHLGSSSSSSLTSELFDSQDSSPSIFASMFAPPSQVLGRGSLQADLPGPKQNSANEIWTPKSVPSAEASKSTDGHGQSIPSRDTSSLYQDQKMHPCHLSSSIYYGGQDIFHHSQNSQSSSPSVYKKDGTEDDSEKASRGNWWQGSLYY